MDSKTWPFDRVPNYLQEARFDKMKPVAHPRRGNDLRINELWLDEKKKLCRVCESKAETGKYIVERYRCSLSQEKWKR